MTVPPALKAINFFGAGLLIGVLAFGLTAWQPPRMYLGPVGIGRILEDAGFDPWTGMGHGRVFERNDFTRTLSPDQLVVREPGFRTWFGTRHAIPVPLGAAAAWLGILLLLAAQRWRRRRLVGERGVEPPRRLRGTGS